LRPTVLKYSEINGIPGLLVKSWIFIERRVTTEATTGG